MASKSALRDGAPTQEPATRPSALRRAPLYLLGAVAVGVAVPHVVPILSDQALALLGEEIGYFLVVGASLVCTGAAAARSRGRERVFWALVSMSFVAILLVQLWAVGFLAFLDFYHAVLIDGLQMLFYLGLVVALAFPPDRRSAPGAAVHLRGLQVMAIGIFLVSIYGYFAVIPAGLANDLYVEWTPSVLMYLTMDLVVAGSAVVLYRTARSPRWRRTFGLMVLATFGWVVTDTMEVLWMLEIITLPDYGTPLDLLWYPAYLVLGAAGAFWFADPPVEEEPQTQEATAVPALAVYPVFLPAVHFVTNRLDLGFGSEAQSSQEFLILISMSLLACVALAHYMLLQARIEALGKARRAEEERRIVSRRLEALGGLAGGIAHDFNNVLAAIVGYGEELREELSEGSDARTDAEYILTAAHRGSELVSQIMTFSAMRDVERRPVSVGPIVAETLDMSESTRPAGVEIRTRIDQEAVWVMGDEGQLHQVVSNLVSNAVDALKESGGEVEVELYAELVPHLGPGQDRDSAPQGYGVLKIRDDGPGIAPEIRDQVFDPFFTTKGVGQGSGLGLSVVHRIVSALGGAVTLEPQLGAGTEFVVRIPLAPASVVVEDDNVPRDSSALQRIMVVDDEPAVARVIEMTLTRTGYEVAAFGDPTGALSAFEESPDSFGALVTDQRMPGMSGLELADAARAVRPDLPVLIVSGYSDALQGDLEDLGLRGVLGKPFRRAELQAAVARLFA